MSGLLIPITQRHEEYLRDESQKTGCASHIAFPRDEREVLEVLALCRAQGLPVTVQGARTGIAAGCVPGGGVLLNLSRMNRVTGCRKTGDGRYAFTAQAGCVLSEFAKSLESKQFAVTRWDEASLAAYREFLRDGEFFFSPDPTERSASLGGMAACNASGARSYRYGATRPYVTALRAVLADGRIIALRRGQCRAEGYRIRVPTNHGGVVEAPLPTYAMPQTKNTSGYWATSGMDAMDLFIGSDGTLGVITELEVKVLPLPGCIWGILAFFEEERQAVSYVLEARGADGGEIASLEYFDGDALDILRRQKADSAAFAGLPALPPKARAAVYTELHCPDEDATLAHLFRLGGHITHAGGREEDTLVARTQNDLLALQFFRHAIPESVNMFIARRKRENPAITKLSTDMAVPPQHLAHMVRHYREGLEAEGLEAAVWGHMGDSHLHVNILPRSQADYDAGKGLYRRWAREVCRLGGAISAEHAVGKLKVEYLEMMYGPEHMAEMRALKRAFDPENMLGRGNIFKEEPVCGS